MLHKILSKSRPINLKGLRGGNPGWDRPDVPINEDYVHRRRISLDYQVTGHYFTGYLPEHVFTKP